MPKEPGYRLHKSSGQAIVTLGGKMFYLGPFGSEESKTKYARLKAEWLVCKNAEKFSLSPDGASLAAVCLAYLDHAEQYYGKGTELANTGLAMRPLSELYATLPAPQFGPLEFKTVRQWWIDRPTQRRTGRLSRTYINAQMKRLLRMFKWAAEECMAPASVYHTLKCVSPLKRGRTDAHEVERVKPVPMSIIEATLKHLSPVVADMVRFQLLVGCRPGEVCKLTPAMVDRSGDVWLINLVEHKGAWRGKVRTIYAGPKAQAILSKYLLRGADQPCFSPEESMRWVFEARPAGDARRRAAIRRQSFE